MGMIEQVKVKARQCVKTIVLPEGDEPRTVQAAVKIVQEKIARPILLGDPARVKAVAAEKGVDVSNIEIVNPLTSPKAAEYTNALYELRKAKGVTEEQAKQLVADPMYYGIMMVKLGDADGLVSGAVHTTGDMASCWTAPTRASGTTGCWSIRTASSSPAPRRRNWRASPFRRRKQPTSCAASKSRKSPCSPSQRRAARSMNS